jgi:hypothetical protein
MSELKHVSVLLLSHQRRTAFAVWSALSTGDVHWTLERPFFKVGEKDTAEELASLYTTCLQQAGGWNDENVQKLYFCEGPGSFTGLRLGCSFLNGLCLGRPKECYALRDEAEPEVLMLRSGVPLRVEDILRNIEQVKLGCVQAVASFQPFYGREPGPVIKLRLETTQDFTGD